MRDNGKLEKIDGPVPVPIPTEIPPLPDFSSLPSTILHSGTVETLLGLNEDLMDRLKINVRRNSILEERIFELEESQYRLKQLTESLQDQMMVLKEKDDVWREKNQTVESRFNELNSDIQLWEVRYAELFSTLGEKQSAWQKERQSFIRRLERLLAFRRRTGKWVRGYIDRLKSRLTESEAQIDSLDRMVIERNGRILDLNNRIEDLARQIETAEIDRGLDQQRLVEQYEERLNELQEKYDLLGEEMAYHKERSLKYEEGVQRETEALNRSIYLDRRAQELEKRIQSEGAELRQQVATYRGEAKTLAVELGEARAKFDQNEALKTELVSENERLKDQLESLRILWQDAVKKLEESNLRADSMNRLNQEISRKLKEQRQNPEAAPVANPPASRAATSEKISQIDSLLNELQAGFHRRAPDSDKLHKLDFLEGKPKDGRPPEAQP